ncbi:MAG: integrase [Sulfuricellaceae bacterium]
MATRSPAMISRLVAAHHAAEAAGHGGKELVYASAMRELGISRATLARAIKEVAVKPPRKRRVDAGAVGLTREEALLISALLMESHRKNDKQLLTIGQALEILRANGRIRAERVDESTGAIILLSVSAVTRALRGYGLHPSQLLRPSPCRELQSLHPNHVWQIDASLCVLYWLKGGANEAGLQVMDKDKFYKNKPKNLARIESERVWSYEITDHLSGTIFVHYVLGAESAANMADAFITAICKRADDPFHGVPLNLMMDMGSANTSGPVKNLMRRLGVTIYPHAAGNARATGQVENARNIIERSFESGLKLVRVGSLDELNAEAQKWARWYNGAKVHARTKTTRYNKWMEITAAQLRLVDGELARLLLTHEPEARKVSDTLTVQFNGREWDVKDIPGVMIGEKLRVTYNAFRRDSVYIVDVDTQGHELLHPVPLVARNEHGFRADANVIGEGYQSLPDTQLEKNRKEIEMVAMGVDTLLAAAEARKAKELAFGGAIDPWIVQHEHQAPTYLPKRGTELPIAARARDAPPVILNHFEAARALIALGVVMDAEKNRQVAAWYPAGVPETDIPKLKDSLTARARLRLVG